MPHIDLASSAFVPGVTPVRVHYRDHGSGRPILILHGGWGYDIYPYDRQIAALSAYHRIVAPDRTGYGGSGRLVRQETDFHHRAAAETFAVIDALGLERPIVWGHSDGAVIALLMGLAQPGRLGGVIAEAAHFLRRKPASRGFFEAMMRDPDGLGERVTLTLAREHGDGWRDLIRTNGDAWTRIANDPSATTEDLYGGRLGQIRVPTLLIHGARDPRTEPGELEAMREALTRMTEASASAKASTSVAEASEARRPLRHVAVMPDGGHSPHSERATADAVTRAACGFLDALSAGPPALPGLPALPDLLRQP